MKPAHILHKILLDWPSSVIQDRDLAAAMIGRDQARYDLVKLALRQKKLIRLKRGVYLIQPPYQRKLPEPAVVANILYGPSFISFHSALSIQGLIPEGVMTVTSACSRRSTEIDTSLGSFSYTRVPKKEFLLGVKRQESGKESYFLASPWRAVADFEYVYKRKWMNFQSMCEDLRIEAEDLKTRELETLKLLALRYPSSRVRRLLGIISRSLAQ